MPASFSSARSRAAPLAKATPEQVESLRQALEANLGAVSPEDFARTDMSFHYAIAKISGNRILTSICDALADWLAEQRTTSMQIQHASEQAKSDHQAIFRAIEAHDPDKAEAAMEYHLDGVAKTYWEAKSRTGSAPPSQSERSSGRRK
jgi:GntR family transcriptional regulator, sialic acid-inducible nan operon repressor